MNSARETRQAMAALVDALGAAIGAGLSVPVAFAELAPTVDPVLTAPTRRAAASLALGATVSVALAAYDEVVPPSDTAALGVVLAAFARSGGRVHASLDRVAALLRGRLALEEERRALTAQSRASALVLVSLAPLGVLFFALAMPDYLDTFAHRGRPLLALALSFEICGAIWLLAIVRSTLAPPDLATLLEAVVIGLDAGLTFEHALSAIVARGDRVAGAIDARRLLADLALGVPLGEALRAHARHPDEARVAALISASTRFGAPLARLLVTQADALRASERHRAETAARRLPVLMLFPLATCILPALLIVFLGPPLLSLLN